MKMPLEQRLKRIEPDLQKSREDKNVAQYRHRASTRVLITLTTFAHNVLSPFSLSNPSTLSSPAFGFRGAELSLSLEAVVLTPCCEHLE